MSIHNSIFSLLSLMVSSSDNSIIIGNVEMPKILTFENEDLLLNGAGVRKKFFVDIYAGGLYLKQKSNDPKEIINSNEAMSIRMHIIYNGLTGKQMVDSINEGFEKSTKGKTSVFKEEMNFLNSSLELVKKIILLIFFINLILV